MVAWRPDWRGDPTGVATRLTWRGMATDSRWRVRWRKLAAATHSTRQVFDMTYSAPGPPFVFPADHAIRAARPGDRPTSTRRPTHVEATRRPDDPTTDPR